MSRSQERTKNHRHFRGTNLINPLIKYIVFLSNFLFLLAGICIVIFGIIAHQFKSQALSGASQNVDSVFDILFDLPKVFIIIGSIIVIISFTGSIGSLRENTCLLKFFSYSLFLIFLGECVLAILAFVFKNDAIKAVEDSLKNNLIPKYRDKGFHDIENFVNWFQMEIGCCGAENYKDWNLNRYFSDNKNNSSPENGAVPFSCCLPSITQNNNGIFNTACGYGQQKLSQVEAAKVIYTNGCVKQFIDFLQANLIPVGATLIGLAILQLMAIFLSRVLCGQIQDQITLLKRTAQI